MLGYLNTVRKDKGDGEMLRPGITFYDRFMELCKEKCVTPCTVARILGFSRSCVTYWKRNEYIPRQETVNKIAAFFNITVDELMDEECPEIKVSITEQQVREYLLGKKNTETNWGKLKEYISLL